MDSLVAAAARALARGDVLGALNRVALAEDPAAVALRGIALAQLGDHARAEALLARAMDAFGEGEPLSRVRCCVALCEIRVARRELDGDFADLEQAIHWLDLRGDRANAALGRLVQVRRSLLLGRVDEAETALASMPTSDVPSAIRAVAALCKAGIHLRRLEATGAAQWLLRAKEAAGQARIGALEAEVDAAERTLDAPVARAIAGDREQPVRLADLGAWLEEERLVVDGCRRALWWSGQRVDLMRRPVLFTLAEMLAAGWPQSVPRMDLLARAFGARRADESHRARLRVEIGRLRRELPDGARIAATDDGFRLELDRGDAVLLLPPIAGDDAALLAILSDGQAWSSSSLAMALGASQRSVQRALLRLEEQGRAHGVGRGRFRRWLAPPLVGFATTLLLAAPSLP